MHHCGVCNRVLTSKGAKNTCWGEHAEPCHRFHQILFMRNRGHTCDACKVIEEAHFKRHQNIAELLRKIRDVCGVQGNLCPGELRDQGAHQRDTNGTAAPPSSPSDTASPPNEKESCNTTKKEKKEAKRLEKAASRARFLTDQEYRYIDEVLHPRAQVTGDSTPEPMNIEEVQEIERNLRFNASTCVSRSERRDQVKGYHSSKNGARPGEVDLRISADLDRVCEVFSITQYEKKNEKNRGLQGKEMKVFSKLVVKFRAAVFNDYVLLYRDEMEVRMRRGGFLRFSNKAIVDRLLKRYETRDWKTGLRLPETDVEEEESGTPVIEEVGVRGKDVHLRDMANDIQEVDEETMPDELSPTEQPSHTPVSLGVTNGRHASQQNQKVTIVTYKKNPLANVSNNIPRPPYPNPWMVPPLSRAPLTLNAPANFKLQAPSKPPTTFKVPTAKVTTPPTPPPSEDTEKDAAEERPPDSAKKARKKAREADRKARRRAEKEEADRQEEAYRQEEAERQGGKENRGRKGRREDRGRNGAVPAAGPPLA